jgi:hypothetical protein
LGGGCDDGMNFLISWQQCNNIHIKWVKGKVPIKGTNREFLITFVGLVISIHNQQDHNESFVNNIDGWICTIQLKYLEPECGEVLKLLSGTKSHKYLEIVSNINLYHQFIAISLGFNVRRNAGAKELTLYSGMETQATSFPCTETMEAILDLLFPNQKRKKKLNLIFPFVFR